MNQMKSLMRNANFRILYLATFLSFLVFTSSFTRTLPGTRTNPPGSNAAAFCNAMHNVGKIVLGVSNDGTFGTSLSAGGTGRDCFTGDRLLTCEYPKGSSTTYIFGAALWIGAVLGRDTLVSTGADGWQPSGFAEYQPGPPGLGDMIYRSNIEPSKPAFIGAISEQDYIGVYYDTCVGCSGQQPDFVDGRSHKPLNLEVTQRTFAWSYSYAEDFVLFDYAIKNIGHNRLKRIYMGIYVDADIADLANAGGPGAQDDLCGFKQKLPATYLPAYCPPDSDIVNVAWTADNDGDLNGDGGFKPVPNVTATRIVRTPSDSLRVSFNWWISNGNATLDFGPQTRYTTRDFGTGGLGTPEGDRNKFYILSNGEFDYDQARVATIGNIDTLWLPPPPVQAQDWATGLDTRYVLSFGPFDVEPGQTLPISLAYVGGEGFHTKPDNGLNLPSNPDAWYANLNFNDLGLNAVWADWIYDNPGVDTDSDGYFGVMTICNRGGDSTKWYDTIRDPENDSIIGVDSGWAYDQPDTIWRKGDGVPDFRGAGPPPAPKLKLEASVSKVKLIWDGSRSENARDIFSREVDFEGYRAYFARDDRPESFQMIASYDIEDYNKYTWERSISSFILLESPFLLDELKSIYANGDTSWHPDNYTRNNPFVKPGFPDSIFYFTKQDFNQSILANDGLKATTPMKKVFPNAPKPPVLDIDSLKLMFPNGGDSLYLTDDDFFKYYSYEFTLDNLLPTVPYWFNVTAFDYGSATSGLASLETSPSINSISIYPLETVDSISTNELDVFVYPNPYRIDANYRERGYEGRGETDRPVDRTRAIHFGNIPPKCNISIYSIDGDLIREIEHDFDPSDPLANHETWDMITRNSQTVVSGLYYWTVEEPNGKVQIGKLVVIK